MIPSHDHEGNDGPERSKKRRREGEVYEHSSGMYAKVIMAVGLIRRASWMSFKNAAKCRKTQLAVHVHLTMVAFEMSSCCDELIPSVHFLVD